MSLVDLHMHSSCSDGEFTPTELVDRAVQAGLSTMALTDHDTIAGLEEAERAAQNTCLTLVRGVELEIEWPHSGEFHLLGLFLGQDTTALQQALTWQCRCREERNEGIIFLMRQYGIDISLDKVKKLIQIP